jgi:hypothetical protein
MKFISKLVYLKVLLIILILFLPEFAYSQKGSRAIRKKSKTTHVIDENKLQHEITYYNVISPLSKSDSGLFLVNYSDEKYYFEIPDSLFGKDMLLVSRIAQIPQGLGGDYINAGSKIHEQVIRWEKKYNKVLLRTKSYVSVASDSLPITISVQSNNYEPLIHAFDIETYSPDSSRVVIDVNKFYSSDINAISGMTAKMRKDYKVGDLDEDRSFIESISSFPKNIEVRHELTYTATEPPSDNTTGTISFMMNQSMVLLPESPMMPRYHDPRVGWLTLSQIDYGSEELKADTRKIIRRWRMEPSDREAYERGELVEPVKPIVYYLDPATPEIWRKYFKEGVELWQDVFETAGFKNAIIAKDPPSRQEDPEFSPEDVRYSVIRYVAATTQNAMGPSVVDPRSGEIIESDIMWYHNHFRSYRNRYMIETGAANPEARSLRTSENDMGEMIKMVIAHEVGHALGLPHNMKASSAYPVDSLRSGTFTREFGIAASIMDYARFNYVAQPEDKDIRFIRQIGPYDHYCINWGYRWIPGIDNPEKEAAILNSWIMEKAGDPIYRFGSGRGGIDPSSQTEDIGNDPVKASSYGLQNLKIVADNLIEWTTETGKDYTDLKELYLSLVTVWGMYSKHVLNNIGGVYKTHKTSDQEGYVYNPVPAEVQKTSLQFLMDNVFTTQEWLIDKNILNRIEHSGEIKRISDMQATLINNLLNKDRLSRMLEVESIEGKNSYSYLEMMDDLRKGIWSDLEKNFSTDLYRRNLQISWIDKLSELLYGHNEGEKNELIYGDICAIALYELDYVKKAIQSGISGIQDPLAKSHFSYCMKMINDVMESGGRVKN